MSIRTRRMGSVATIATARPSTWLSSGDGVSLVGAQISAWRDVNGKSFLALGNSSPKRPTATVSATGAAILLLDGVDDTLYLGSDVLGVGDLSVSLAVKLLSSWSSNARLLDSSPVGAVATIWTVNGSGATGYLSWSSDGAQHLISSAWSLRADSWHVLTVTRSNSGLVTFYVNGQQSGVAGNGGVPIPSSEIVIGNRHGGSAGQLADRALNGYLGDVVIVPRVLSTRERLGVERQLGRKFGVSV